MSSGHLVADRYLPLVGYIHFNQLFHAGGQFVPLFAGKALHIYDYSLHAVGHPQRGIADFPRLFAEDRVEQLVFRGQVLLALGSHLAHQNVIGLHVCAAAYDAVLVKVAERLFRQVGDVPRDHLAPELGLARLHFELLDMDRGVGVLLDQFFRDEDRVLKVISHPWHEGHQDVLAQGKTAVVSGRAVGEDIALLDFLALFDHRALVEAGALIGPLEFHHVIIDVLIGAGLYLDGRCID